MAVVGSSPLEAAPLRWDLPQFDTVSTQPARSFTRPAGPPGAFDFAVPGTDKANFNINFPVSLVIHGIITDFSKTGIFLDLLLLKKMP